MLKISTKTRYALRAMLEMACRKGQKLFSLGELSAHQHISRKYLEQIFRQLKIKGLVKSRVGKLGGFYLPENLRAITILRILEALEGDIQIVDCRKKATQCDNILFCPAKGIWQEVNTSIKKILASKNLKELSVNKKIREGCSYFFLPNKKPRR